MPPKRLHTTVAPTPTPTPPPSAPPPPSTTDPDNAVPKKKPKHDKDDQTDAVDTRPMCRYGVNCYRRNPQHFIEYRHPTKPSDLDAIRSEHEMMKEKARQAKLRSSSSSLSSSSTSSLFDTKTPPASPPSLPTPTSKPKSSTPKKSSSTLGSILDPTKVDDSVDQTKIESYKVSHIQTHTHKQRTNRHF